MSEERIAQLESCLSAAQDRLWAIHKIATQSRVLPEDVDRIAEISEGYAPIPADPTTERHDG